MEKVSFTLFYTFILRHISENFVTGRMVKVLNKFSDIKIS